MDRLDQNQSPDFNPFSAPESESPTLPDAMLSDEALRQRYIETEMNIRSLVTLYGHGALVLFLGALIAGLRVLAEPTIAASLLTVFLVGACVASLTAGKRLNNFERSARSVAVPIAAIWLVLFPFGTVLAAATLFTLLRPQATFVLSNDYLELIKRTPLVKHRTRLSSWLIAIIAVGIVIGIVAAAIKFGFVR